MSERFPLANKTAHRLRSVFTRGAEYDFMLFNTDAISRFFDDFHSKAIDTTNVYTTGGGGTAAAMVASTANGEIILACNNNMSSIYLPGLRWSPSNDCVIRVGMKLDTLTNAKVEIGFSDNVNAASIGATGAGNVNSLAATPTLNTGASDIACAIVDSASGLTNPMNWRLVTAKAATTSLATPTTTSAALKAPVAATYQTITLALRRIELGATDDTAAVLYVGNTFSTNQVEVARVNSGAITTAATVLPYVAVKANGATAVNLTLDFIEVYQLRNYAY